MSNDLREAVGTDSHGRGYSMERKSHSRRPKKEGHDELIARLAPVGTTAWIYMASGNVIEGELKGSDRFTITVGDAVMYDGDKVVEELTDEKSPVFLVYKHSIEGFKLRINGDKAE